MLKRGYLFGTLTFFKNSKIEIIPYISQLFDAAADLEAHLSMLICVKNFKVSTSSWQMHCSSKKITHNKFQEAYFTNQIVLTNYSRQIAKSKLNKAKQIK